MAGPLGQVPDEQEGVSRAVTRAAKLVGTYTRLSQPLAVPVPSLPLLYFFTSSELLHILHGPMNIFLLQEDSPDPPEELLPLPSQ